MQLHRKIKFFAQQTPQKQSFELLKHASRFVVRLFREMKKDLKRSDKKERASIKEATNRREVDSVIIETMVLHCFQPGNSIKKILPLLQSGTH